MKESGEKEIRQLFERMRVHDRSETPSFRQTVEGRQGHAPSRWPGYHLAKLAGATALLALISAALFVQNGERSGPPPMQAVAAMSSWVSPTESLLHSSAQELLSGRVGWVAVPEWTGVSGADSAPKEEKR